MGCGAGSILGSERIFGQYMGPVPSQHYEKLDSHLVVVVISVLKAKNSWEIRRADHTSSLIGWMLVHLCLRINGGEASSRLADTDLQ